MPKIRINSRTFEISNLNKIIFPNDNITKGEVIGYYMRIADRILPHLKNRPLTIFRYPDGIAQEGFVQQEASDFFPDWVGKAKLKKRGGGTIEHFICSDCATLAYLVNLAAVSFHVWLSSANQPGRPDRMVFDLDPPGDDFEPARFAARTVRDILAELGAPSYVMTTGSRGLHVVVPLNQTSDFEKIREKAREIADIAVGQHPDKLTTEIRKEKRAGRLYIDISRNAYGQTTVAPYSLRAKRGAPVATPLGWNELSNRSLTSQRYTILSIFRRVETVGDPWLEMDRNSISIDKISPRLAKAFGRR